MHYFGRTVETLLLRFGKVSGSCQVWGTTSPTHTPSRSVAMGLLMQLPTYESRPRTEIVISMRLQLLACAAHGGAARGISQFSQQLPAREWLSGVPGVAPTWG